MLYLLCLTAFLPLLGVRSAEKLTADSGDPWHSDKFALFPKMPIALTWSEDEDCRRDSQLLLEGLENRTLWAMQMYDSSSQEPFGVLYGHVYHLGNFDECMQVKEPLNTHMCLLDVKADLSSLVLSEDDPYALNPHHTAPVWQKLKDSRTDPSKVPRDEIKTAVCVPRSCSQGEVEKSLNTYLSKHYGHAGQGNHSAYSVQIKFECANDDKEPIGGGEFAFWIYSILLVLLSGAATIKHVYFTDDLQKETRAMRLLMAFSLKKNFSTFAAREGEPGPLDFLYGVKFITIVMIILDHRCAIILGSAVFNYELIEEELRHFQNLFLPHGDLLVDSFFYIAGLISCYLLLDTFKKQNINPFMVILGRYIRLAPLYLFSVWFYASALERLGSGVGWHEVIGNESLYCRENWWTNALFVNNYVNAERMCMLQAWFLACDFHFFICCTILVLVIVKNQRLGLGILFTVTIVSIAIPGIVAGIYNLSPTVIFYHDFLSNPRNDPTYLLLYVKSHTRITVYLMGMISGYYLFKHRASTRKYGLWVSAAGIILGLALLFAPMVYGSQYYVPGNEFTPLESAIFAAFRRVVWAVGCVVLMFTHRFASIPWIGTMCSCRAMVVLSKLTYGMYLTHFIYQVSEYAKAKISVSLIFYDMAGNGMKDIAHSMIYALFLYLILELPTRSIFKELIFARRPSNSHATPKDEGHDNPVPVEPRSINSLPEVPTLPTLQTVKL